jgi:inhibitor of cysteine peptidase
MLTRAEDGRTVTARPGDEIVVRLAENATTGYRWEVDRAEGPILPVADEYHLDPDVQFGSGGTRELRLRATGPGTARLELKHWQPWEGEASVVDRFRTQVEIA